MRCGFGVRLLKSHVSLAYTLFAAVIFFPVAAMGLGFDWGVERVTFSSHHFFKGGLTIIYYHIAYPYPYS